MKTFKQYQLEKFNDFLLSDEEMIFVRGGSGDSNGDDGKGETIPPVTEPEI